MKKSEIELVQLLSEAEIEAKVDKIMEFIHGYAIGWWYSDAKEGEVGEIFSNIYHIDDEVVVSYSYDKSSNMKHIQTYTQKGNKIDLLSCFPIKWLFCDIKSDYEGRLNKFNELKANRKQRLEFSKDKQIKLIKSIILKLSKEELRITRRKDFSLLLDKYIKNG